jgi:predicted RNase H-like HicB family nuclease
MEKNHIQQFYIVLTIIFRKEDDVWTARCEELGTSTFGETFDEAKESLKEAITLHLNTLEKVGERKRFFEENGIPMFSGHPKNMRIPELPFDPNTFVTQEVEPIHFGAVFA